MSLNQIYEGWRNSLNPPEELKELISKTATERLNICFSCEHNSKFHNSYRPDEHCVKCGCTLSAKTKCLSCQCPLDVPLWRPVLTPEQEKEMKQL